MGLLSFYLDSVDTAALNNVENGRNDGRDAPFLPLIAPWLFAGPLLIVIQSNARASFYIFTAAIVLSVGSYAAMAVHYFRTKQRYRKSLGLPNWREQMRQKVMDDMAKLD